MLKGSCLCGTVSYEYAGLLGPIVLCHCRHCRKAQGSAFATVSPVASDEFRFVGGRSALKEFELTPGKKRAFCGQCGSPIYSRRDDRPQVLRLRVGTLDTPVEQKPAFHIFAASKAEWFEILDGLPQYEALEPGRGG